MEIEERPAQYVGPNLDPSEVKFTPKKMGRDVWALMASPLPRDNSGLIVGRDAALMIDAGINGEMARKLQAMAAKMTDKPLKYLVNTNYHGDHTFGNYAFPKSVEIIASRRTAESMSDLPYEKRIRSRNLFGKDAAIADVKTWRKPDRVFDDYLEIDLGGRIVQLWHFGPGNTPGDTIVYEPETKTAWTGNFLGNAKTLPMLLEAGPLPYVETVTKFKNTLDIDIIIPGHGPMAKPGAADRLIRYLYTLYLDVKQAYDTGLSAEAAVEAVPLRREFKLAWWFPSKLLHSLERNFQRLNVLSTYRSIEKAEGRSESKARPDSGMPRRTPAQRRTRNPAEVVAH